MGVPAARLSGRLEGPPAALAARDTRRAKLPSGAGSGPEHFDVAVVGGGPAGVAAALAAADRGARTILLEAGPALGGNATGAFVHTICGLYPPVSSGPLEFVNPGLPARFVDALTRAGGPGAVEEVGKVRVLPTDPSRIEGVMADHCARRPALDVRLESRLERARLATDAAEPSELYGAGPDGAFVISSEIVIDTSGDGVAGSIGGAAVDRAPDTERQLPSYIVRLGGVPAADTEGFGRLRWTASLARAARRGGLPPRAESALLRPVPGSADAYLTLNLSRELVAEAGREPGALERAAREIVEAVVNHLRAHREGYGGCRVVAWSRHAGHREGRRLRGHVVVEATPLLAGERSVDEVALSSWPIELWHDHRRATYRHPESPYGIPLGALVSVTHPRLGTAGRCMSASHEALGALRVIGTALATGEAIGAAAAIAADRGLPLTGVQAGDVRRARDALIVG